MGVVEIMWKSSLVSLFSIVLIGTGLSLTTVPDTANAQITESNLEFKNRMESRLHRLQSKIRRTEQQLVGGGDPENKADTRASRRKTRFGGNPQLDALNDSCEYHLEQLRSLSQSAFGSSQEVRRQQYAFENSVRNLERNLRKIQKDMKKAEEDETEAARERAEHEAREAEILKEEW